MATYDWLQAAQVQEVAQVYQQAVLDKFAPDPIFDILAIETVDESVLMWDQLDNDSGLMNVSAYDGAWPNVQHTPGKEWLYKPGVYKESYIMSEKELTNARRRGTFGTHADMAYHVDRGIQHLTGRKTARMKKVGWDLVASGTFTSTDILGNSVHTDTFNVQSATQQGGAWSNHATSTPIADLQQLITLGDGQGVSFGPDAKMFMNNKTFRDMTQNSNSADLGGVKGAFGETVHFFGAELINTLLTKFNLPQIVVHSLGYFNETTKVFTKYIPDGKVVIVGKRMTGEKIGAIRETYNLTLNKGGWYLDVVMDTDPPFLPRIFSQVNFGPVIYFPTSLLYLTVT